MPSGIERLRYAWRLYRICRVLRIEPYAKTVSYILDDDDSILYGGRRCGKTTAVILDILVRRRAPTSHLADLRKPGYDMTLLHRDPDYEYITGARLFANSLLYAWALKCDVSGIKVGYKNF